MQPELKRHAPTNFAEHDADAFGVKIRTIFFPFLSGDIYRHSSRIHKRWNKWWKWKQRTKRRQRQKRS